MDELWGSIFGLASTYTRTHYGLTVIKKSSLYNIVCSAKIIL